jgi:ankyrin repeat protein
MSSFFKKLKSLASPSLKRKKSKSNQSLSSLNTSSCAQIYQVKEKDLPKLHLAAWRGDADKCRQYAKADKINSLDKDGRTALHLASDAGHLDIVRLLCEEGADLIKRDRDGRTAFFIAVINAYFEIIELIYNYLDNKMCISMTDTDNSTALHYASACKNINILKFLIDTKQFSINVPDKVGFFLFF